MKLPSWLLHMFNIYMVTDNGYWCLCLGQNTFLITKLIQVISYLCSYLQSIVSETASQEDNEFLKDVR